MSQEINILSRSQVIIVDRSGSIAVVNAGPIGPAGPPGETGPEGPPGPAGSGGSVTTAQALLSNSDNPLTIFNGSGIQPNIRMDWSRGSKITTDGTSIIIQPGWYRIQSGFITVGGHGSVWGYLNLSAWSGTVHGFGITSFPIRRYDMDISGRMGDGIPIPPTSEWVFQVTATASIIPQIHNNSSSDDFINDGNWWFAVSEL